MANAQGIDVSSFQGAFDWAAEKGSISFAFAKATEGSTISRERAPSGLLRISELTRGSWASADEAVVHLNGRAPDERRGRRAGVCVCRRPAALR